MATYRQIQDYIRENGNGNVRSCWIADIKERHKIPVRRAWSREPGPKRVNPCPDRKTAVIENALRHFKMIE